jgi:hypothetical protein
MATKKTRPEHVETVNPATEPGVVDMTDVEPTIVTIGEPTNQPTNQPTEEIPPGHSARTIILSDEQWSAIDRQATRNKSTGSQWLRRFLRPYLRRG